MAPRKGKTYFTCKNCGNLKKKAGQKCAQPCLVDMYGDPYFNADKKARQKCCLALDASERFAKVKAIAEARSKRATDRADARELAQAKAKKPKLMRELEGSTY